MIQGRVPAAIEVNAALPNQRIPYGPIETVVCAFTDGLRVASCRQLANVR